MDEKTRKEHEQIQILLDQIRSFSSVKIAALILRGKLDDITVMLNGNGDSNAVSDMIARGGVMILQGMYEEKDDGHN